MYQKYKLMNTFFLKEKEEGKNILKTPKYMSTNNYIIWINLLNHF